MFVSWFGCTVTQSRGPIARLPMPCILRPASPGCGRACMRMHSTPRLTCRPPLPIARSPPPPAAGHGLQPVRLSACSAVRRQQLSASSTARICVTQPTQKPCARAALCASPIHAHAASQAASQPASPTSRRDSPGRSLEASVEPCFRGTIAVSVHRLHLNSTHTHTRPYNNHTPSTMTQVPPAVPAQLSSTCMWRLPARGTRRWALRYAAMARRRCLWPMLGSRHSLQRTYAAASHVVLH